ncbi:hypothetical protein [Aureibaculum luteum]|uniref:hypothetical protein n=1 Tax=Aureibaculum luteum TaxID=1548456 RepID=UPI001300BDDE|nr:hypothetical protein [Aureibaculum luteum]
MKTLLKFCIVLVLVFGFSDSMSSQNKSDFTMQIVLDKNVDVGGLTLYPGVKDKNSYWYLPNKLKLANNEDGTPKFSLIKWVYNEESDAGEGIGGGVLHCVFGFEVTKEDVEKAQEELKGINPKGKIVGAVTYKSGVVNVSVPKLNDPDSHEYVGETKAPIMDNSFIAINLLLDKRSTSLLWESFNTPNPVVTFNFDMVIAGYNSPIEALIIINYDKVYNTKRFKAGIATSWASSDIDALVKETVNNGAIKIKSIGANFTFESSIKEAIKAAKGAFFKEDIDTAIPKVPSKSQNKAKSASQLLAERKKTVIKERGEIIKRNNAKKDEATKKNKAALEKSNSEKKDAEKAISAARKKANGASVAAVKATKIADKKAADLKKAVENKKIVNDNDDALASEKANAAKKVVTANKEAKKAKESAIEKGKSAENEASKAEAIAASKSGDLTKIAQVFDAELEELPEIPSIQITASYTVKKIRKTGIDSISFKESHPTVVNAPFGGNLEISRSSCPKCFLETNLDDDVFKQREIVTVLDGLNENDFVKYINYGTIQLRKKHESGKVTYKQIRITRNEFKKEGNLFKMIYGWKGDVNRSNWFNYDYQVNWSFFGGNDIETDWLSTNKSVITLSPPISRQVITIRAEKELLIANKVRIVDVKVYYNLGGRDLIKSFTIYTKAEVLSGQLEFMLPVGIQVYDYEITWRLSGNREIKSGRKTTSTGILLVDELPN